ncbi:MAG TPA: NUDIX domain-containing protein [Iamia sp.]|nr:NUDIX domain-containing protein [Iamia sp.]
MPRSPYIERIRAEVGHDLLLLPSAAVLPVREDGAVLLARHHASDRWETIGGMVEPGEDPADAARREVLEEIGVEVRLGALLGVVGGPDFVVRYPNGDECAYVSSVWEATIVAGEPIPDGDELTDLRWFAPSDLADADLGPFCRATLRAIGWLSA